MKYFFWVAIPLGFVWILFCAYNAMRAIRPPHVDDTPKRFVIYNDMTLQQATFGSDGLVLIRDTETRREFVWFHGAMCEIQ